MENDINIKSLVNKVKQQERQVNQLRAKLYQLQEALIFQRVYNSDSKMDKLSPVELINNNSKITIIAFGGMLTSLGMPSSEFFGVLNKNNNFNIIFVKDYWQSWYQKGLLGVSNSVYEAKIYLESIIPKSTVKTICLGTSSGGFAAILFSELLNANRSISFSPQVNIDIKTFLTFRTPDSRWSDIKDSEYLDLRKVISGNVNHKVFVGKSNSTDMAQINLIKSMKSVDINYLNTDSHNIAGFLKNKGRLHSTLKHVIEYGD